MKNKKLVSKIGSIALCAVMAVGSVVSANAAVVDDSEVGSLGYGRKVISLDSTGQTVLCKKDISFQTPILLCQKILKWHRLSSEKAKHLSILFTAM